MKPILTPLFGVMLLVGTGCSGLNPTVGQLERWKRQAAAGEYTAISQEAVDCKGNDAGCAQLYWIKADSCRRLAANEPAAARREYLDCAIQNDEAALKVLAQRPDQEVNRNEVELALLDSLQLRRDAATNRSDADRQNQALLERATAAQRGPNARPAGFYYAADAELNSVLLRSARGGCTEVARAAQLLSDAKAGGTEFATPAANLNRAIANARSARGCST